MRATMLWSLLAAFACIAGAHLLPLRDMARSAGWGVANYNQHGGQEGIYQAHKTRLQEDLDSLNAALDDSPVVKHMDNMAKNAAWGAANERAYGKTRAGVQVDWDAHRESAQKVREIVGNDALASALESAAKHAAWHAANTIWSGHGHEHTERDWNQFREDMDTVRRLAPEKWPVKDVEGLFTHNALLASSQRESDLKKRQKDRHEHLLFNYGDELKQDDWTSYHRHAEDLEKELGKDQDELAVHFEGMAIEAAWGAGNERRHGKHSNNAKVHWKKYNFHADKAQALYKGKAKWGDIHRMVTEGAWGPANSRAFGANSDQAKKAWKAFEEAASAVTSSHGGEL